MRLNKSKGNNPLRFCRECGKLALTLEHLNMFVKSKKSHYGRQNLCKSCDSAYRSKGGKYYETSQKWGKENPEKLRECQRKSDLKRFRFRKKIIRLKINPRTNACSRCGRKYPEDLKRQTDMHHDFYNPQDPLANTQELCLSCHNKERWLVT